MNLSGPFDELLTSLLLKKNWSLEELADRAVLNMSTLTRIRSGGATSDVRRRRSVQKLDSALDAKGELLMTWEQLGGADVVLTRDQVAAVHVERLPLRVREREFARYQSSEKSVPMYLDPPKLGATAETLYRLDRLNPLPTELLATVGQLFEMEAPTPDWSGASSGASVWRWCAELEERIGSMWHLPVAARRARLDALTELVQYLSMVDGGSLVGRLRDVDIVFVLCGRTDHQARVAEALAVVEAAIDEPPQIVICGSPALMTTDSMLSEPDAVWHSLVAEGHAGGQVDLSRVIRDGRAINYSECASLAVGHSFRLAEERRTPLTIGLVAGRMSMRRGWWCFRRAFEGYEHVVSELVALPASGNLAFPARADSPSRSFFESTLMLELRKLLYLRLGGVA